MKNTIKTILIAVLFTGITLSASAKDANSALDTMLESYNKVILSGDAIKALDYTYIKMYDIMPKEKYIQMIKQMEKGGVPKPKITAIKQTPVYPVKKYDHGLFTLVNYSMDMQMNLAQPGKDAEMKALISNPEKLASYQTVMKTMLTSSLGKDSSIDFEKNSLLANIHKESQYIAINEDNKGWQIIELAAATVPILENILPKEILAAYKKQIQALK